MSFAAVDFLAGIVTVEPSFSVVLTLWLSMIAALGGSFSARFKADLFAQGNVDLLPHSCQAEPPVLAVNGAPRREVRGQHAPRATAAHKVEDGVDHFASINNARASARLGWRNQWRDDLPLFVAEVAGIAWSFHGASLLPHPVDGQAPP